MFVAFLVIRFQIEGLLFSVYALFESGCDCYQTFYDIFVCTFPARMHCKSSSGVQEGPSDKVLFASCAR